MHQKWRGGVRNDAKWAAREIERKWNKISFAHHPLEKSAPEEPLILCASRLDPSSFPAGYQQNNNLIKELVTVEK